MELINKQVRLDHPRIVALLHDKDVLETVYCLAMSEAGNIEVKNWLQKKILEVNSDIIKTIEELAVEKDTTL